MARRVDQEDPEDNDKALASPPASRQPSLLMSRNLVLAFLAFGVVVLVGSLAYTIVSSKSADADPDDDWSPVRRSDWKASPPKSVFLLKTPAQYVVVSETATEGCSRQAQCTALVHALQQLDLLHGFPDITHNFLVGGDGAVFEGRGWGVQCPLRHVRAAPSLAVSLLGTYSRQQPSAAQLRAVRRLIRVGVRYGYVAANYTLLGDLEQDESYFPPGHKLLEEISTWPRWSAAP